MSSTTANEVSAPVVAKHVVSTALLTNVVWVLGVHSSEYRMAVVEPKSKGISAVQGEVWLTGQGLLGPLQARLDIDGEVYTAAEPITGIFGCGPDLVSAIEDLRLALREHLEILENEASLSEELSSQRQFLRLRMLRNT